MSYMATRPLIQKFKHKHYICSFKVSYNIFKPKPKKWSTGYAFISETSFQLHQSLSTDTYKQLTGGYSMENFNKSYFPKHRASVNSYQPLQMYISILIRSLRVFNLHGYFLPISLLWIVIALCGSVKHCFITTVGNCCPMTSKKLLITKQFYIHHLYAQNM